MFYEQHQVMKHFFIPSVVAMWIVLGPHITDVYPWLLRCVELQPGRTFHSCPSSVNDVLVFDKTHPLNTQLKS